MKKSRFMDLLLWNGIGPPFIQIYFRNPIGGVTWVLIGSAVALLVFLSLKPKGST